MGLIYILRNELNGKCYIGQTRGFALSKRWNSTLTTVRVNPHLTAAITKYGARAFSRHILCYASCQQELDLLERFWIYVLQTTNPKFGYNVQSGGRHWRGEYTPELRRAISEGGRKAWAKKTPKERWEFGLATKLKWLMRSERERERIGRRITKALTGKPRTGPAWNKGLSPAPNKGRPSQRKGRTFGPQRHPCRKRMPFTAEHCQNISRGLKKYFAAKRREEKDAA